MIEIIKIYLSKPVVFFEMVILTLFANVFALIPPIFVILVFNRYISSGVNATLITLSIGAIISVIFEFLFRRARHHFAEQLVEQKFMNQDKQIYDSITKAQYLPIHSADPSQLRSYFGMSDTLKTVYSASNLSLFLDVPFAFLFIAAIYFISPMLSIITLIFIIITFFLIMIFNISLRKSVGDEQQVRNIRSQLIDTAIFFPGTVRAFDTTDSQNLAWEKYTHVFQKIRKYVSNRQNRIQTIVRSSSSILTILIISVGATMVTKGVLDIGVLIGANILAARALLPIIGLSQQVESWARTKEANNTISRINKVPLMSPDGTGINKDAIELELRDISFTYPFAHLPIFDRLNITVGPGEILCVYGGNGTGKTTLAKMLCGLMLPSSGDIFVDGINLQQISSTWWFNKIVYLPQEPDFINDTLRNNFSTYDPDLGANDIHQLLKRVDLLALTDENPEGLDQKIKNNGRRLSLGVRRRLALARALCHDGVLAILDEPTEGMDPKGASIVYNVMNELVERKCTMVVFSHDRNIVRGAHHFLNLGEKKVLS
ncbi:MAG: Toxin RTX-I translocation ATP-binding protein [Alphaproteobacteria bacterium MarineAlpha9_Bin7]|nr:MAG: Toxin RTX-I translocation ATP-binding protein [Alphaproteobacteria bacterium MarineAlpha9_Bin7]